MKKLLSSKILAIAICVIMLFTTLIFCISFMIVQKSTPVSMQHNIPENPIAGSVEEINTLSSTTYNSNATICYHEDFAINRIKNIVKKITGAADAAHHHGMKGANPNVRQQYTSYV